jgi:c(7)-type cytochrome triheme protein
MLFTLSLGACNTVHETTVPEPVPLDDSPPVVTAFVKSAIATTSTPQVETKTPSDQQTRDATVLVTGKKLHAVEASTSESPRNDGIHDPVNAAIAVLQNPAVAMKNFPRDRRQQVDWVQALEQGHIKPRADLLGESTMTELDLDILMKNTQFMPWVKFPHDRHTKWLACSNCHPAIFAAKEHANPISMNKVLRGEYCGVCHDKVAFALFTCERCHSVPHEGSGSKWW